jgi:hypothetical protein
MAVSRRILFPHKVTVGGQTRIVKLPDIYDGNGSTIGSALGVSKLPNDYELGANDEELELSAGIKSGKLLRVRISWIEGTGASAIRKSSRVICSIDNAKTAIASVLGKTIESQNVRSAGFPRRRRLY